MIILDLDNTICDDSWRVPYIDWDNENVFDRFHAYHSLHAFDQAANFDLFANRDEQYIVMTARPQLYEATTREWLQRNGILCELLLMRPIDSHAPSLQVKEQQLKIVERTYGLESITAAFDDRVDICALFGKYGVPAFCRPIHEGLYDK